MLHRFSRILVSTAFAALLLSVTPAVAHAQAVAGDAAAVRRGDMVIVQVAHGSDAAAVERRLEVDGAIVTKTMRGALLVTVPQGMGREQFADVAEQVPGVSFAQVNTTMRAAGVANDPRFGYQWGLSDIGATTAWSTSEGSGVAIAVIDTGVDPNQPDLAGQVVLYKNYVNAGASAADDNGHGTHVAGIIAGIRNNSTEGVGASPKAKVYAFKVLDASGNGDDYAVAQAIRDAVDYTPCRIISMSLGGEAPGGDPILTSAVAYAQSKGAIVVAAAGNAGTTNATYPAAVPGVIGVGAVDNTNKLASFSNYGSTNLDVVAPGVNILSTIPGTGMAYMSGTSMATPFVSAAVADIWAAYPKLTASQVVAALTGTALDLGTAGKDSYYGYGLVRIDLALTSLAAPAPAPEPTPTPAPEPTPTPAPTPDPTVTPSPSPDPTVTPSPSTDPSTAPVPVATALSLYESRTSVARYRAVKFSGTLKPSGLGNYVRIYVVKPGASTWTRIATVKTTVLTTTGGAKWSYTYKPSRRGTYKIRVKFAGTSELLASTSRTLRLRVY